MIAPSSRYSAVRLNGFQAFTLTLLVQLDTARRELDPTEYTTLLEIVATRIARDIASKALSDREAA